MEVNFYPEIDMLHFKCILKDDVKFASTFDKCIWTLKVHSIEEMVSIYLKLGMQLPFGVFDEHYLNDFFYTRL